MNMQKGLQRVSVVWWGMWMVLCAAMALAMLFARDKSDAQDIMWLAIGGTVLSYVAHRLTCWIIQGFFPTS